MIKKNFKKSNSKSFYRHKLPEVGEKKSSKKKQFSRKRVKTNWYRIEILGKNDNFGQFNQKYQSWWKNVIILVTTFVKLLIKNRIVDQKWSFFVKNTNVGQKR